MVLRRTMPLLVALMVLMLGAQLWSPVALRAADAALVAADTFGRTTSGGWGQANTGGTYRLLGGSAKDYSVSNTVGRLLVTTPGSGRVALLPETQAADVDITVQVQSNKVALGGNQYAYVVARRTPSGDEYRTQVRFEPSGAVRLRASRMIAGRETLLGMDVTVPKVTHAAGKRFWLRVQVTGRPVTTIRARSWLVGATEATTWQVQVSDQAASLQVAGSVGLRSYLNSNTRNAPVSFGFAQWTTKVLMTEMPSPTATTPATGTPSPTATIAATATPSPAPTTNVLIPPSISSISVKDSAYPIPAGAYFVAPNGNDSNSGTQAAPWRTVGKAVKTASTGATIVLRGGTYREYVTWYNKALTLQPYPHEQVWLKGSVVVTGWERDGTVWRKSGWSTRFRQGGTSSDFIDPAYPVAASPDMLFVDGKSLQQVASAAAVGTGSFHVDYASETLTIGDDPNGKTVEGSVLGQAMYLNQAHGSVLRGLGFMHYATHPLDFGMVKGEGSRLLFENNTFAWSASIGLSVLGTDAVVRGNSMLYNGQIGLHGNFAHRMMVEGNRFAFNNQEHFKITGAQGGMKLTSSNDTVWRNNVAEGNLGRGLWCDIGCYNTTIVHNTVRDNAHNGIQYEISSRAIIASNLVVRNGEFGIYINESGDVDIYNNTLVQNRGNIRVWEGYREQNVWDVNIKNNILSHSGGIGHVGVLAHNNIKSAQQMGATLNHNAYYRTTATSPATLVEWGFSGSLKRYRTFSEFRQATGQESNGLSVDDVATNPFFVDESTGNYTLATGSAAVGAGTPLPQAIADAIGVQAGVTVDLGILE